MAYRNKFPQLLLKSGIDIALKLTFILFLICNKLIAKDTVNFDASEYYLIRAIGWESTYKAVFIADPPDIAKLDTILDKAESEKFLCGFQWEFIRVKNKKIINRVRINEDCEADTLLHKIINYLPNRKSNACLYNIEVNANIAPSFLLEQEHENGTFLHVEDTLKRYPKVIMTYRLAKKKLRYNSKEMAKAFMEKYRMDIDSIIAMYDSIFDSNLRIVNKDSLISSRLDSVIWNGSVFFSMPLGFKRKKIKTTKSSEKIKIRLEEPEHYNILFISNYANIEDVKKEFDSVKGCVAVPYRPDAESRFNVRINVWKKRSK